MHDLNESDKELFQDDGDLEEALMNALNERASPETALPNRLFLFPLYNRPVFPGMAAPIFIEHGPFHESLQAVAKSPQNHIGLILTKEEHPDVKQLKIDHLHATGVVARILRLIPSPQGVQVILNVEQRFTIKRTIRNKYLLAEVEYHPDRPVTTKESKVLAMSVVAMIKDLLTVNPLFKDELQIFLNHADFTEIGRLADFAAALTTASRDELQEVLATRDLTERVEKVLVLLQKEINLAKLQHSIHQKLESTLSKSQKEYFLREQIKMIKKELSDDKEDKSSDAYKFQERLKERKPSPEVMKVIDEEMEKLAALDPLMPEYNISRNYLDWLTILPWGMFSDESHDLVRAKKILESEHWGLKDIKERILEFISVGKLSGEVKGSILCLVGPPGVGKTSVGKSIAHALNRKFFRFSVGGMRDEAEIKGHRRTYLGAMPGKLVQALKQTKTMNPVIMLDEVDKMGNSYHGDPASALLEVLDPEQNKEFLDHYMDVPVDLSHVLFIITANVLDTIPAALRDRMDILRLSGYIAEEKVQIAERFLLPKHLKQMGLKNTQVKFSSEALHAVIHGYAREAGVRTLEGYIRRILRKIAHQTVEAQEAGKRFKKIQLTPDNLAPYIGKPEFTSDRFYDKNPIGVCTGLAWTSMGGATLYIEAVKLKAEKNALKLTGQLGKVMKESAEIAWSYVQSKLYDFAPDKLFFDKMRVHLHVPEGATPKDGPSAGVTMTTALLSLLLERPINPDLAMTGEMTLVGKVLPVGGIKEKLIAARRSSIKEIILPAQNRRDYDELQEEIKEGINVHFVHYYDEVFALAFPSR